MRRPEAGRWWRALAFAVVTTALAAGAHGLESGTPVGPDVVLAALAGTAGLGWFLVPRRRPLPVVVATVLAQAVLHTAFCLTMGPAMTGPRMTGAGMTGSAMAGMRTGSLHSALEAGGARMLAAHAVAAILVGAWLDHGERRFTAVLLWAATALVAVARWLPLAVPALEIRCGLVETDRPGRLPRTGPILRGLVVRGPPVAATR